MRITILLILFAIFAAAAGYSLGLTVGEFKATRECVQIFNSALEIKQCKVL